MPVFGQLLPIVLGVIVSPIAIAVVIALLMSRGRSVTGGGFVFGWAVGLFALTVGFAWLSLDLGVTGQGARPALAVVELVAAGLLVVVAVWQLLGRGGLATRSLRGLDGFRMPQATALGFAGAVFGPKTFLLSGVAGATVATWGSGRVWAPAAMFALLGSIGVALPVLLTLIARGRATQLLVRIRSWITAHDRATSVATALLVALVLVLDAVGSRPA